MIDYREVENILDTYTLEEVLEQNDLTEEDVLYILIEQERIQIPEPKPLDVQW